MSKQERQYNKLADIAYGTRPKVLLVGNGLNLSFSESDIWWLISFKKCAFPDSSFNLYERDEITGIRKILFNTYNINCPDTTSIRDASYVQFYKNICSVI